MSSDIEARALAAQERAYAPYSGYRVGAAIETMDGRVYDGCNVENSSYSVSCCAERVALFSAVADGARSFRRIAVTASGRSPYPCGSCRQALAEFAPRIEVTIVGSGGNRRQFTLDELLPHPFTFSHDGDA